MGSQAGVPLPGLQRQVAGLHGQNCGRVIVIGINAE
jgi:hypothetical protein